MWGVVTGRRDALQMPRGGKRDGAGRRKIKPESADNAGAPRKSLATEILDSLGSDNGHPAGCWCQRCLWRADARRTDAIGHAARKYLWDRADGKPVDTVNHLHDKPLDVNVSGNITISEVVRDIRQRKQEYERTRQ